MGVAVRPGGVEGHVGGFDVVRVCPVAYAGIGLGRKVRAGRRARSRCGRSADEASAGSAGRPGARPAWTGSRSKRAYRDRPAGTRRPSRSHVADAIGAGEGNVCDRRYIHALGGKQHHLGPAPGHHRSGAATHDPKRPVAFLARGVARPDPLGHSSSPGKKGHHEAWGIGGLGCASAA